MVTIKNEGQETQRIISAIRDGLQERFSPTSEYSGECSSAHRDEIPPHHAIHDTLPDATTEKDPRQNEVQREITPDSPSICPSTAI
jgi:hypothetical protein